MPPHVRRMRIKAIQRFFHMARQFLQLLVTFGHKESQKTIEIQFVVVDFPLTFFHILHFITQYFPSNLFFLTFLLGWLWCQYFTVGLSCEGVNRDLVSSCKISMNGQSWFVQYQLVCQTGLNLGLLRVVSTFSCSVILCFRIIRRAHERNDKPSPPSSSIFLY